MTLNPLPIRHFTFVVSMARLFAGIYNIRYSEKVRRVTSYNHNALTQTQCLHTCTTTTPTHIHDTSVCCLFPQDQCEEEVARVLREVTVPEYKPSEKVAFALHHFDFSA